MLARQVAVPAPVEALCLALECGGSDALSGITANPALGVASDLLVAAGGTSILAETSELIGAEHLLARRAVSPEVGAALVAMIDRFERIVGRARRRPARRAAGARQHRGRPDDDRGEVARRRQEGRQRADPERLAYAEAPRTAGLHVMDTPGNDIEQMVGMVAAGCNVVAFTTGRGTPTGSPIAPCIKIASNSSLYRRLDGDLDVNAGTVLDEGESLADVGRRIYASILAAAAGRLTAAERNGNREFSISREQPQFEIA